MAFKQTAISLRTGAWFDAALAYIRRPRRQFESCGLRRCVAIMEPRGSKAWAESPEHDRPGQRPGFAFATVYQALKGRNKRRCAVGRILIVDLILCRPFRA